jgi:hypothetical protein
MPEVRMSLADAVSFKPLPEDTYDVEIIEVQGPTTSDGGTTYITPVLEVSDGDHQGRRLFHNVMLDGKGAGMGAEFLSKALGEDIDVDAMDEFAFDTDDLIGVQLRAVVVQREYPQGSGEFRNEVRKILTA